jgi:hypothetical protein
VLDIVDALAALLEPWPVTPGPATDAAGSRTVKANSGVVVDLNAAEPVIWRAGTLYLFEELRDHRLAGVGNPPEVHEHFGLRAILALDAKDEEAAQLRRRDVSALVDTKTEAYLAAIAAHRSIYGAGHPSVGQPTPWAHLAAASDADSLRTFQVRGVALRINGYRIRAV